MKEFVELHDFEEGSPIMIGIDDIEAVYESDEVEDALVIQVNDGMYNVKESYFELKKFLDPYILSGPYVVRAPKIMAGELDAER